MRFYALDGHGAFLTNNQEPSRAKSGDELDIPIMPRADKHHQPSLGLEPTGETEERKTMFDMEKKSRHGRR